MIHIRTLKQLWLFNLLFCSHLVFAQQQTDVNFLFVGDVMGHDGQLNAARNKKTGSFSYDDGFKFVRPIIQSADFSIANLEITHAGEPFKGYPKFSSPPELSVCLMNTGFDILLTANNHSCDGGSKGVLGTLDVLDDLGIMHTGTFRSPEERDSVYPLMIEKNGFKIALLNYTYGTNGLSVDLPLIINYIDSVQIKKDVATARERGAEFIICTMHWGKEYESLPSKYQYTYEKVCYNAGVDMVIGGHPHVLQPVEHKVVQGKDRLTAWSLGNFVSNQRARYKNGGMMLTSTVSKSEKGIAIRDVNYMFGYVHIVNEGEISPYYILPEFNYNDFRSGFVPANEMSKMKLFFDDSRELFQKHNQNTSEIRLADLTESNRLYERMLSGFFCAEFSMKYEYLLHEPEWEKVIFKMVDVSGNEHLFYKITDSVDDLEREKAFLNFCFPEEKVSMIRFQNGVIKSIEE